MSNRHPGILIRLISAWAALAILSVPVYPMFPVINDGDGRWLRMERPARGYARPPFAARPHAATIPSGLNPTNTRHAYGFDLIKNQGAGQTIGIVDAYDDPNIQSDLNKFDSQFGLPTCTSSNGCFRVVYASGRRPQSNAGWALEISLDVQWAHAIAPQARIVLVEATTNSFTNLFHAVDVAVQNGASVVSMSWGGSEFSGETSNDNHFNVNNVSFTASAGDSGSLVEYPAAAPGVLGVGGTTLTLNSSGNYSSETAWSGSGGGLSNEENEPLYQENLPIPNDAAGKRGVPDVAYDADPSSGFAVYDSVRFQGQSGWFVVGGTSAGAPQWAALVAIVNSMRVAAGKTTLTGAGNAVYAAATANFSLYFNDITSGSNGTCGALCTAAVGYDYVTGLGSPQVVNLVPALVNQ